MGLDNIIRMNLYTLIPVSLTPLPSSFFHFSVCGLLLPKKSQRAYYAIRAFNVELASIKDGSSLRRRSAPDQAPGGDSTSTNMTTSLALQMRMQWWRDAVQAIYEDEDETVLKSMKASPTTPDHLINLSISCWNSPVVRALDRAHAEMNLTRRFLERLIDAREMDLDVRQHASLEEAVSYAEDSVSSLLYLSLECTGVRDDQADIVASHAGVGIGLTNTCLRAMRFRLSQGEISLPAELFPTNFSYQGLIQSIQNSAASNDEDDSSDKTNLDPKDLAIVNEAINHVANEALAHLQTARDIQGQVPKHGRSALLPVVPAIHYLNLWNECSPKDDRLKGLLMAQTQQEQKRLSLLLFLGRAWLTGVI